MCVGGVHRHGFATRDRWELFRNVEEVFWYATLRICVRTARLETNIMIAYSCVETEKCLNWLSYAESLTVVGGVQGSRRSTSHDNVVNILPIV
jgi:hypothetical protein